MKLLIVESPAKAKTINKYLGSDYKVISSYGHVRGLPSEDGSVDTANGFAMRYQVLPKSGKQVAEIVKDASKADAIMLATDPDREGEAISWHIYELLRERKAISANTPVKRVVFNEITKKAVIDAVNNPRDLDLNLVYAQQARQALDYLVGFTLSPVLWRKLPGSRSAGRVQSVALRMICDREAEIERFRTQEYWTIHAACLNPASQAFKAFLTTLNGDKLDKFFINNAEQASALQQQLSSLKYSIIQVENKKTTRKPSPPFTTSTMLQEASRKLGFSAKKTAQVAQKLYEGVDLGGETVGLITYMRTDSTNLSADAVLAAKDFIDSSYGSKYVPKVARVYKTKSKNAQEAHEAIRPTNVEFTPEKIKSYLDKDLFNLYELIWKRLVASQMADAEIDIVSADISDPANTAVFRAVGSTIAFDGFLKLYHEDLDDDEEEESRILPPLRKGDDINITEVQPKQHFTQPPPRFSEASLVKRMEELGIGRPSTYPTIISILQEREYVNLDRKRFIPQTKGRIVSSFLTEFFAKYVEYSFTSELEDELDNVSNGTQTFLEVLQDFWSPFKARTEEVISFKNQDIVLQLEQALLNHIFPDSITSAEGDLSYKKCPKCNTGTLGLKTGKFGSFIGCSNYPECNHTKQLSSSDGAPSELIDETADNLGLPKVIGTDPSTQQEISLRKGPYGIYLQRGDGKTAKRAGLPKGMSHDSITMDYAVRLLSMPLVLGNDPSTNEPIKVGIGKFGPYLEKAGKYTSLKQHKPMEVTLEQALEVLAEAASKPAKPKSTYKKKQT